MNLSSARFASLGLATLALFLGFAHANPAQASSAALVTAETVANVTVGSNTQTNATTSTTGNTPETKATRTLTVSTAPLTATSITIGTCTIAFATTTAGNGVEDTDCYGNATVLTTTNTASDIARTPTQIANALLTLTHASSSATHGNLTVSASSTSPTSVVFTTAGTESSATNIIFTDGTTGKITSPAYSIVTGVIPVAQVWTVTPANVEIGDTFTTIINGTTVSFTATAATVANVTAGLTAAINASSVASAVTAADQGTRIDVTSDTAGTAFTITTGATNRAAAAQQITVTPTNFGTNIQFSLTINGVTYFSVYGSATAKEIVESLNSQLVGNTSVLCSEDDATLTCTSSAAGTAFTYSTAAYASGGGGGGSSHRSHASSSTAAPASTTTTGTTVTTSTAPAMVTTSSGSFTHNLTIGTRSSEVAALQAYLNAHGFAIAAAGTAGSAGHETTTFGAATRAALVKFQAANGIKPASGFFGPLTRAFVAAH